MATADELIREAEFAFRNISPGSTNQKKYTSRARRLASRIVRRHPGTIEAEQAQQILARLQSPGELVPSATAPRRPTWRPPARRSPQPVAPSPHPPHAMDQQHTNHVRRTTITTVDPDSWAGIGQKLTSLTRSQKNVLGIIAFFGIVLFATMPFLLFFAIWYALKPERVRRHLNSLLDSLDGID